jgi:hypothetical protein
MSEIGSILAQWLNKTRGTVSPAREGVCGLLTALHGLEPLLREHPLAEVPVQGHSVFMGTSPGALLRDAINKQLADYQFTPSLIVTDPHIARVDWLSHEETRQIETAMIRLVCDLYNEGTLSQLRECLCGKWFMARGGQQHHSLKCRQKLYAKTEVGRDRGKKASQAHYYRVERQPKIMAIQKAIKVWESKGERFKATHNWKGWVADAASVEKVFITRAINRREINVPTRVPERT